MRSLLRQLLAVCRTTWEGRRRCRASVFFLDSAGALLYWPRALRRCGPRFLIFEERTVGCLFSKSPPRRPPYVFCRRSTPPPPPFLPVSSFSGGFVMFLLEIVLCFQCAPLASAPSGAIFFLRPKVFAACSRARDSPTESYSLFWCWSSRSLGQVAPLSHALSDFYKVLSFSAST